MRMARHDRWGAYIEDVKALGAVTRTQGLDGTDELEFDTLQDFAKGDRIALVDARGEAREYEVTALDASRSGGVPVTTVYAEDAVCELAGCWIDERQNTGYTAAQCLEKALDGTRWTAGTCDAGTLAETATTSWYHESVSDALEDICDVYGLELETSYALDDAGTGIGARYVSLLEQRGGDEGKRFSYGKDLAGVRRTVASDRVVTRAYGYGAAVEYTDEETGDVSYGRRLDFADVNDGLEYVDADDDVLATWGMLDADGALCHVAGVYTNTECDDADQLLAETKAWLEEACEPSVTYEADVAALGLGEVGVGDVVRIVDTTFPTALRLEGRVTQIKEDLAGRSGTAEVTLGNVVASLSTAQQAYSQALASVQASASVANVAASTALSGASSVKDALSDAVDAIEDEIEDLVASIEEAYVKGEYLEENYYTKTETEEVVSTELETALYATDEYGNQTAMYATTSQLTQTSEEILAEVSANYVSSSSLADYVTDDDLAEALEDYVGSSSLATTLEQYSTTSQTAEAISSAVEAALYATDEDGNQTAVYATTSQLTQTSEEILSQVAATYLSSADAEETYASQSYVDQTATSIMSQVATLYVSTDTLESNYSTTEQTEELVSSTVSNSLTEYLTSGEIASLYATQTEVEQTAEEVTATVSAKITSRNVYPGFAVGGESPLWYYLAGYTKTTSYGSWEVLGDGWARCDYDYSSGTSGSQVVRAYMYPVAGFEESTDYTCLVEVRNVAHESGEASLVGCAYPSSSNVPYFPSGVDSDATVDLASAEEGEYRFDVTTIDDFDAVDESYARSVCVFVKAYAGSAGSVECRVSYYKGAGYAGPYAPWTEAVDVSSMMRATTDGLEVARKVNGEYTSTRTLVDDEGFHVLSADGEELSSFGADSISLAETSSGGFIDMLGARGAISCTDDAAYGVLVQLIVDVSDSGAVAIVGGEKDEEEGWLGGDTGIIYQNAAGITSILMLADSVQLGYSTVGSSAYPVYLSSGVITKSSKKMLYESGDTISLKSWVGGGYCTSSGTAFRFSVPLDKPHTATGATCSTMTVTIRQGGSYLLNAEAVTPATVTLCAAWVSFSVELDSAPSGVTNNDDFGIIIHSGTLTFT